jgi:hypothetical protein
MLRDYNTIRQDTTIYALGIFCGFLCEACPWDPLPDQYVLDARVVEG